ncbi:MAG: NUDIX domain-containing protein [Candidatus Nanoarchaeia archaeon]|nr:NUDIX domain-containing protein [Candidatus Nanoarchaeia archaeon]
MDFRVAAKAFIVDGERLLIIKRSSEDIQTPEAWEIPGGRLHLGEDPKAGLKRETKEETGLDIEVLHPIDVKHFTRNDGQTITMLIFLCRALNKNIKLSNEHSGFEWIEMNKSKEKLTEFFHEHVDKYKEIGFSKFI